MGKCYVSLPGLASADRVDNEVGQVVAGRASEFEVDRQPCADGAFRTGMNWSYGSVPALVGPELMA